MMLHRTVYVLGLSMLVGGMTALALSADSLSRQGTSPQAVSDTAGRTHTCSPMHNPESTRKPVTHHAVCLPANVLQNIDPAR